MTTLRAPLMRPMRRISAAFVQLKPGDVLLHPRTNEPIAKVVTARNATTERAGKPNRYTVSLVLEDIE